MEAWGLGGDIELGVRFEDEELPPARTSIDVTRARATETATGDGAMALSAGGAALRAKRSRARG